MTTRFAGVILAAAIIAVANSPGGPPTADASHPYSPLLLWRDLKPGWDQTLTYATCPESYPTTWLLGIEDSWDAVMPLWNFYEVNGCSADVLLDFEGSLGSCEAPPVNSPIAVACVIYTYITVGDQRQIIPPEKILFDVNHLEGHNFLSWGPNWQRAITAHEWAHVLGLDDHLNPDGTDQDMCVINSIVGFADISRKATDNPCFVGPTTTDRNSAECTVYSYCHDSIGVARPGPSGYLDWYLRNWNSGGAPDVPVFSYGVNSDKPVVGDWNGDGVDTIGVARPGPSGYLEWYLRNSNSGGAPNIPVFSYGVNSDTPIVGDWNGDGIDTIGVFRAGGAGFGEWYLRNSNSPGSPSIPVFSYGLNSDKPIPGDWDGTGTDTPGVFRPSGSGFGGWHLRNGNSGGPIDIPLFTYGANTDTPKPGDWNLDGITTPESQGRGAADTGSGTCATPTLADLLITRCSRTASTATLQLLETGTVVSQLLAQRLTRDHTAS